MIGREKRVLLRHYLEQGMNKAVIARDLGVSRRTVYHWIETGQLDRELDEERVGYGPRCLMPSKLDPYKPLIDTCLKEYAKLTAVRLFKEVRAAGYPGSYNQVKRYVRKVRPRPPEEPVVRFETAPGRQGQVDFAHFRLPWGKRYALIVVLGYSRLLWVQFYTRQTMKALMHGLESSFSYFGGVPRELLFDPHEGGRHRGRSIRRWCPRREPGVHALRLPLELQDPSVPTLSGSDQGQGGAADPLPQGELLLRAHLHVGRRSQRAGPSLA